MQTIGKPLAKSSASDCREATGQILCLGKIYLMELVKKTTGLVFLSVFILNQWVLSGWVFVQMGLCSEDVFLSGGVCPDGVMSWIHKYHKSFKFMVVTFHDSNYITITNIWGDESGGCRGKELIDGNGSRGIVYVTVMNFVLGPHTRLYERQPASPPARQPASPPARQPNGTSLPLSARQSTSRCLTDVTAKFISGPSLARGRAVTGCDILRFASDLRARILAGV